MAAPLARYESFLISNSPTIATIESSLRSITWFLPGRFKDAELASEALNATLNLLSLYHDTLLARRLRLVQERDPKLAKPLIPPSPHNRYTRTWSDKDSFYKWGGRALEIIRYTELLIEMGLRRSTSKKNRWRGLVLIEILKAILRSCLLYKTQRQVLSPPIPERDIDPATLPALEDLPTVTDSPIKPMSTVSDVERPEHLRNNHITFASEDFLLPKALTPLAVRDPQTLLRPITSSPGHFMSEIIHILRPLIYVIMLRPSRRTLSSLRTPLAISLFLDLLSRHLRPAVPASAVLERAEYARRDRDLLWYLFRGEVWREWTRPKLMSVADRVSGAPLIGLLSSFIADWVPLIDDYHYYTAT